MRTRYLKNNKIRVLLAENSFAIRKKMVEIIEREDDMQVVAEALNGKQAVYYTEKEKPEVILMDVVMPVMDGQLSIEKIMNHFPTHIIVCSSAENAEKKSKVWNAIKSGAFGKIENSAALENSQKWEHDIVRMIRAATRGQVKARKLKARNVKARNVKDSSAPTQPAQTTQGKGVNDYNLVCFGISTGGTRVIAGICNSIPKDFPLPVLLVMHMSDDMDAAFYEWFKGHHGLKVVMAKDGMDVKLFSGNVIVALPGKHMTVSNGLIRLIKGPLVNYCRPSVDELFFSVAKDRSITPIGVLLTGIGRDGAEGLKAIKTRGGYTICQDEATSIIYGMPGAGIQIGAALEVLPDYQIAGKIISLVGKQK